LTSWIDWGGWSTSRSGRFTPGKETNCTECWVNPRGRSGKERKISCPSKFDPRTVQSVASRYTDRAAPASPIFVIRIKILPLGGGEGVELRFRIPKDLIVATLIAYRNAVKYSVFVRMRLSRTYVTWIFLRRSFSSKFFIKISTGFMLVTHIKT
jgi:hypothetical protein